MKRAYGEIRSSVTGGDFVMIRCQCIVLQLRLEVLGVPRREMECHHI